MANINKMFTLDGIHYTETESGYHYKTTGKKDKKGNDITVRIPKHVFEERFEEYVGVAKEIEKWEKAADAEHKERMDTKKKSDREAEKAVNKNKKASRRSKDIAHESNGVTLTSKQVDFLKRLPKSNYWDNGLDSALWCDCLADEIGGQFAGKPMTIGAMVSTLREKSLIEVTRDDSRQGKPKFLTLTDLGKEVAKELGLK